jgi:hypothetical protein
VCLPESAHSRHRSLLSKQLLSMESVGTQDASSPTIHSSMAEVRDGKMSERSTRDKYQPTSCLSLVIVMALAHAKYYWYNGIKMDQRPKIYDGSRTSKSLPVVQLMSLYTCRLVRCFVLG